jgi:hypothetical protein
MFDIIENIIKGDEEERGKENRKHAPRAIYPDIVDTIETPTYFPPDFNSNSPNIPSNNTHQRGNKARMSERPTRRKYRAAISDIAVGNKDRNPEKDYIKDCTTEELAKIFIRTAQPGHRAQNVGTFEAILDKKRKATQQGGTQKTPSRNHPSAPPKAKATEDVGAPEKSRVVDHSGAPEKPSVSNCTVATE